MAGKIKFMIDRIIKERTGGNQTLENVVKTKLILKGINPDNYSAQSQDDPAVIKKIMDVAQAMGVKL